MRVAGQYTQNFLQRYPGVAAAKDRVMNKGRKTVNVAKTLMALYKALSKMSPDQVQAVKAFVEDRDLINLIARRGYGKNLLMAGLVFEEVGHKMGNDIQGFIDWVDELREFPEEVNMEDALNAFSEISRGLKITFKAVYSALTASTDRGLKGRVNLTNIFKNQLSAFAMLYPKIETVFDSNVDEIFAHINEERLAFALFNIFINSKQHGAGRLEMKIERIDKNRVRIEISDDGEGINRSNLDKVWTRGFTTKGKYGHGFGLPVVKDIIEDHNGTVAIDSPGEGLGCTVTIILPTV